MLRIVMIGFAKLYLFADEYSVLNIHFINKGLLHLGVTEKERLSLK